MRGYEVRVIVDDPYNVGLSIEGITYEISKALDEYGFENVDVVEVTEVPE